MHEWNAAAINARPRRRGSAPPRTAQARSASHWRRSPRRCSIGSEPSASGLKLEVVIVPGEAQADGGKPRVDRKQASSEAPSSLRLSRDARQESDRARRRSQCRAVAQLERRSLALEHCDAEMPASRAETVSVEQSFRRHTSSMNGANVSTLVKPWRAIVANCASTGGNLRPL